MRCKLSVVALVLVASYNASLSSGFSGQASVIDCDTLEIHGTQPSPPLRHCMRVGDGFGSRVECNRCKTRASLPLDAIRRAAGHAIWKLEAALKCRSCKKGRYAPPVHMIKVATALRNHLDFGTVRRGPANAMNNSGTVTRGGGSGATLEAFPRPAGIYRDWHISRCRRACVSRI